MNPVVGSLLMIGSTTIAALAFLPYLSTCDDGGFVPTGTCVTRADRLPAGQWVPCDGSPEAPRCPQDARSPSNATIDTHGCRLARQTVAYSGPAGHELGEATRLLCPLVPA